MENEYSLIELEKLVISQLRTVFDPELPVNIYDLGLVYDIKITSKREVIVLMTLTSPNCPVADSLIKEVEDKVKYIDGVTDVKVIITFDPPWTKDMLSDAAKLELGLL